MLGIRAGNVLEVDDAVQVAGSLIWVFVGFAMVGEIDPIGSAVGSDLAGVKIVQPGRLATRRDQATLKIIDRGTTLYFIRLILGIIGILESGILLWLKALLARQ